MDDRSRILKAGKAACCEMNHTEGISYSSVEVLSVFAGFDWNQVGFGGNIFHIFRC